MVGCCVTEIRANLQLVLDHYARKEHTGRRGKVPLLNLYALDTYSPGYRAPVQVSKYAPKPAWAPSRKEVSLPCRESNHDQRIRNNSTEISEHTKGWTISESNPGEGEIFRTRPDRPWDPPSLCTMGTESFSQG